MTNDFIEALRNPNSKAVKKFIYDLIQHRYTQDHDEFLERMAHSLVTKKDVDQFVKLVSDIYETAYTKCFKDNEEIVKSLGGNIRIKPGQPSENKIFGDE
jgi:uncharacterized membrane-anchored protein YjiN (DUF445 family)